MRDAARVLGYPYVVGDKIAKLMPPLIMGRDTPLHACFEQNDKYADGYKMATELRALYDDDPDATPRHRRRARPRRPAPPGRHPRGRGRHHPRAAHRVPPDPAQARARHARIEDAPMVTQYEMHGVEDLGLLKMDFLGLRNLDVMEIALDLIEQSTGDAARHRQPPARRPEDLRAVAARRHDRRVPARRRRRCARCCARWRPTTFEDVAAVIALYRPGPMAQNWHNEYADRKNGRKPVTFDHPDLEEILGPTYGLMIYQEQLMRVSQKLAGTRSKRPTTCARRPARRSAS